MIRHLAGLLLALSAAAAAPAPAQAPVEAQSEAAGEADTARQILVMIKLAPAHFRPGAGYGGDYGDAMAGKARERVAKAIARRAGLTIVDGWPMPLLGIDCYVMQLPDGSAVDTAIASVSKEPQVEWSEPMRLYRAQGAVRADPLFAIEPAAVDWRLAELHRIATGRGVRIAIVDSRVEIAHPDLAGQFVADQNFVTGRDTRAEQHGTGVAGIIGAKAGNGLGIAGIAPDARLMALRACWQSGNGGAAAPTVCDSLSLAKALHYAIDHGAQVINLSLSGPRDVLLERLIAIALARGANVVAAYDPSLPGGGYPASQNGVIPVYGAPLQPMPAGLYIAPGRDVPTTQPGGKWNLVNGSSYAAAHVSGLVALARQQRRTGTIALARSDSGLIAACATVIRTPQSCDCSCTSEGALVQGRGR